jgi:hypothetical protein
VFALPPTAKICILICVKYSILWAILFGIFGKLYIGAHPTPHQPGQTRMKNAVWIDLANLILWFITFLWDLVLHFTRMDKMTLHTGRAHV